MRATVIIAQYGQSRLTVRCIDSFRRAHGESTPLIVVDDGSAPGDIEPIAGAGFGNLQLIRAVHRGVTAAWNRGARQAAAEILVFLNNDTISTGRWLEQLVEPLQSQAVMVAGAQEREERRLPDAVLRRLPTTTFVQGWCFAVRRSDLEAVGGFRESLRLYFSDTDLQARLLQRAHLGREGLACTPVTALSHLGHATTRQSPERRPQWLADRRRFIRLWEPSMRVVADRLSGAR